MGKRTLKTPNIRAGDTVRIVTPAFFVRCGYPLDYATECERVQKEKKDAIKAFLSSQGIRWGAYEVPPAVWKIARALAYEYCKQAGWGGKERKIYTHEIPELAGRKCIVEGVRFVKTGIYNPARPGGYYSEGEYDPPYLGDEKSHRIVATNLSGYMPDGIDRRGVSSLEIDAANVAVA